jgi:hypothetical protein
MERLTWFPRLHGRAGGCVRQNPTQHLHNHPQRLQFIQRCVAEFMVSIIFTIIPSAFNVAT